ncbi:hypothetical protein EX30DRAFT_393450 [Ascodesmis nigricans]|uniref:DUF202 domain-containing protein n=1 Tax=Ascodesmis nigricans TaxID=341454 RepID=A0A4S2N4I6_9PEZI|nr:hypothetical protein EX30DRAFT_393450 [Ascodesmis nigricans]
MSPPHPSDDDIRRIPSIASPAPFATPSPPPRSLSGIINSSFSPTQDTELQFRPGRVTFEAEDERRRGLGEEEGEEVEEEEEEEEVGWSLEDSWVGRFWRRKVSCTVPGEKARDHLALERTYLAYHRTSLVLALFSVVIAQLHVLQHSSGSEKPVGLSALGKPLSGLFGGLAIVVSLVGVARWWRLQQALLRGKAVGGGWEIIVLMGGIGGAVVVMFGVILVVEVRTTYLE